MKRTFAVLFICLGFALTSRADDVFFYFGVWSAGTNTGYAYVTENDTSNRIAVSLVRFDGAPVQTRSGAMSHGFGAFKFTNTDGRKMALNYSAHFPFTWKGTSQLLDGTKAHVSCSWVNAAIWETLGLPPSP